MTADNCIKVKKEKSKRTVGGWTLKIVIELFLIIMALGMIFPILYIFLTSGKTNTEIANSPFSIPNDFSVFLQNYTSAITGKVMLAGGVEIRMYTPFIRMMLNSLMLVAFSLIFLIVCAMPIGYALGRRSFKGKDTYMLFIILVQTVPLFGYLTAFYFMMDKIGFTNNLFFLSMIYAGVSMPSSIIFMKGFYSGFPPEVEEAAEIDGAGELKRFLMIVLPMSKGIIISIILVSFMGYWNEYAIASILITQPLLRTIPINIMLSGMGDTTYQTYVFPLLFLSALPTLIFFTIFQKGITQGGLSLGSIKG